MDIAVTIVMMIPVILAVALIVNVVRKNITEREAGDPVNITGVIPAVIVLVVAVMIIGSMGAAIAPYSWDEESGELTINKDVGSGAQDWDSYGTSVKSLIINGNVETVADGAFDTLTGLEYVSISDSVESITSSAFGVTLKDYLDQTITEPEAGEYVGTGDGTLYFYDDSIFTYNSSNAITGLTSGAASAVNIVIPAKHEGTAITGFGNSAFASKTTIQRVLILPETYSITALASGTFSGCTGIAHMEIPGSVKEIGYLAMSHLDALTELELPANLETIGNQAFSNSAIEDLVLPVTLKIISSNAFQNSSGIRTVSFPASIESIGTWAFSACSGVTQVSFASGFAPVDLASDAFRSWTFYDSDGTTTIDKTVASNLAGFTFQGTASALVKVVQGAKSLNVDQLEAVKTLTEQAEKTALLEPDYEAKESTEILSEETELASA